jgi:hypothetical protein
MNALRQRTVAQLTAPGPVPSVPLTRGYEMKELLDRQTEQIRRPDEIAARLDCYKTIEGVGASRVNAELGAVQLRLE